MSTRKSPESADVGERLRRVRNERGLTAREVAVGMGLTSPDGYRQYEKGNIVNWPVALLRLARGLRMDAQDLADRLQIPFDPQLAELESRIRPHFEPERADQVEQILRTLATLPPHLQDRWIEMMRVSMLGMRAEKRDT